MPRPAFELADIFRRHGADYRQAHPLALNDLRILRAIEVCRTSVLGGHREACGQCDFTRLSYNSCRNRHCPKCQSLARAQWLERRAADLLPIDYFHLVFTLPEPIAQIAFQNKALVYNLLFQISAQTLRTIAGDPKHLGAEIGFFSILHTWGQQLTHHPHIHCVATGGGLAPNGEWIACRPGFFLPVKVLSRLFRRLFCDALEKAFDQQQLQFFSALSDLNDPSAFHQLLQQQRAQEWVVYAKPPFGGPSQVLAYLGRYTHRIALSNDRILNVTESQITLQYKDYRSHNRYKSRTLTLNPHELIRRFLLHAVPPGFQRIRHYGLLSNRQRQTALGQCRALLSHPVTALLPACQTLPPLLQVHLFPCPKCKTGTMVRIEIIPAQRWPQPMPLNSS